MTTRTLLGTVISLVLESALVLAWFFTGARWPLAVCAGILIAKVELLGVYQDMSNTVVYANLLGLWNRRR